jgi:hypothetical protein
MVRVFLLRAGADLEIGIWDLEIRIADCGFRVWNLTWTYSPSYSSDVMFGKSAMRNPQSEIHRLILASLNLLLLFRLNYHVH